jgi:1-acyl-sn-glycerol-3-phosphate acyltransferase
MNGLKLSNNQFLGGRRRWFFWIMRNVARMLLFPFFCLKICGKENLPGKSAFVLLAKHQRWEDIPLLGLGTPRPLYYVAKHELFKNPLSNWFFQGLGGLPLNRERPLESRKFLRGMIEMLKGGEGLVVFPEGTYYRGRMGRPRVGVVRLILSHLELPFIPVGIHYMRRGWRVVVTVNFGKPVFSDSRASVSEFLDLLMADIARLSGL